MNRAFDLVCWIEPLNLFFDAPNTEHSAVDTGDVAHWQLHVGQVPHLFVHGSDRGPLNAEKLRKFVISPYRTWEKRLPWVAVAGQQSMIMPPFSSAPTS